MRAFPLFLLIGIFLTSTSCVGDLFQEDADMLKAKVDNEHLTLVNSSNDTVYFAAIESELLARANYSLRSNENNQILPDTEKKVSWIETGSSKTGEEIVVMYWTVKTSEIEGNVKNFTVKR